MGAGKRNTEIKKIEAKAARYVCFSKRREGLFKKAEQYHNFSGSHIAMLVLSPSGRPHVHGSPSFDRVVDKFLHSSDSDSCVSDDDMGLRERVKAIKVEECESLEELVEMKRKLEQVREMVVRSFVDSLVGKDSGESLCS